MKVTRAFVKEVAAHVRAEGGTAYNNADQGSLMEALGWLLRTLGGAVEAALVATDDDDDLPAF